MEEDHEKHARSLARGPQHCDPDRRRHFAGIRLATFRDADGIWATVRLEEVATPEAFARDPARVLAFYEARRRQLQHPSVTPNAAHEALARLEAVRPGEVMIATQNIDDLHERAGSRAVIHMHGELLKARCTACGQTTLLV